VFGVCDYRRGVDWIIRFIDHLYYTPLGTTGNTSAIANFHTLRFTAAPAEPFPAYCVLTSRSLTTTSNSGDCSASRAQVLPLPTFVQDCLPAIPTGTLNPIFCCNCQLPTISLPSLLNYSANCQFRTLSQLFFDCRFSTDSLSYSSTADSQLTLSVTLRLPILNWLSQLIISRSRSLLPATSRHAHSWHRVPLGPMAVYLFSVKTFVFFLSLIHLVYKGGL
jgi:hypothetical protein